MSTIKAYKNIDDQQKLLEPNKELMQAAAQGDIEKVKKLILSGADIYFRDHHGDTALSLAAGNGYLDILEYLSSLKKVRTNRLHLKSGKIHSGFGTLADKYPNRIKAIKGGGF